jgi:hypothetical protein
MRRLQAEGIQVGGGAKDEGQTDGKGRGLPTVSVADICGAPTDRICCYFAGRTDVALYANDPHPPIRNPQLAATKAPHTMFSRLDASSQHFPTNFLDAIASHSRSCHSLGRSSKEIEAHCSQDDKSQSVEKIDYIITSPPYDLAVPILDNALQLAGTLVAMKLPINFVCPGRTQTDRRELLAQHPPSCVIPMCKADNSESYNIFSDEAWFVWLKKSDRIFPPFLFPFTVDNV